MRLEDYFDFLASDDIRIKNHRVGIESVLYEYIHDFTEKRGDGGAKTREILENVDNRDRELSTNQRSE